MGLRTKQIFFISGLLQTNPEQRYANTSEPVLSQNKKNDRQKFSRIQQDGGETNMLANE